MKSLKSLSKSELILATVTAIKTERQSTLQVLWHLREIERRKLYFEKGFSSLFEMVTKHFGYSASAAQRRISSMRLIREMPEVESKIESGELSLTAAASVQSFFKEKTGLPMNAKREVIASCTNKSSRDVEKELASRNPEKDKRQDIRFTRKDRLRLSLNISEELYVKLESLKYLYQLKGIEDVIVHLADNALSAKSEHQQKMDGREFAAKPFKPQRQQSRFIPMATRKIVAKRNTLSVKTAITVDAQVNAQTKDTNTNQCEHLDANTQNRCGETTNLQFDHIRPYSKGGPNIVENLRLLCAAHNREAWWKVQRQTSDQELKEE